MRVMSEKFFTTAPNSYFTPGTSIITTAPNSYPTIYYSMLLTLPWPLFSGLFKHLKVCIFPIGKLSNHPSLFSRGNS